MAAGIQGDGARRGLAGAREFREFRGRVGRKRRGKGGFGHVYMYTRGSSRAVSGTDTFTMRVKVEMSLLA
jgi:hypothetical protein